jgi:uncharacterized protein (TIGR03437 family)
MLPASAQTPDWRRIGGASVDLRLAAPAGGPVDQVWFGGDGSVLYVRTHSGRTFRTADFETWSEDTSNVAGPEPVSATAAHLPEGRVRIFGTAGNREYALGRNVYRSEDGGRSWTNLTAYRSEVVIGPGQLALAVAPLDPNQTQIVVGNDWGVWRSMDGGLSWSGLNGALPNLAVRRILSTPAGLTGTRIQVDGMGILELPAGGSVWTAARGTVSDRETELKRQFSETLGVEVSAVAASSDRLTYAGTADGRIFVSQDGGRAFQSWKQSGAGRVERIFSDPANPEMALAVLSGKGPHVWRTVNGGAFWDSIDGNLPDVSVRGVTAERSSNAVYVATDRGVFWAARVDLQLASVVSPNWTNLSDSLLSAPATDVLLDPAGVQLYAAFDGYGVYATAAPHRIRDPRIINAGDFSLRPAAPGSLLIVSGARISGARGENLNYPVLAMNGADSQIQVPFEAIGPNVSLALNMAGATINRNLAVQPVSPAILVSRDGLPMLFDGDSGLAVDARTPAHSNGRLQIWMTGLGRVRPDWTTGMPAPVDKPPSVVAPVRVMLDRQPLQVTSATLLGGYVGFYLVEVQLPPVVNLGTSDLVVVADGQESNHVPLVIEP